MGVMCSWVAVKDAPKETLLEALGLMETGELVDPGCGVAPMSCYDKPDGWVVLFSEDFEWADSARVKDLSRFGFAVGCQFEDKVEMHCIACAARDGLELWRIFHVSEARGRKLDVTGEPPPEFVEIREKYMRLQAEEGDASSVDYIFEIPLEVAKSVCGYDFYDDVSQFAALAPLNPLAVEPPRLTLLDKLLAPFRRRP